MPPIEKIRVFRWLWVAWVENDFRERRHIRRGFTERQAADRTVAALWAEDDDR